MTISLRGGGGTVTKKTLVLCCEQVGSQVDSRHLSVSTPCLLFKCAKQRGVRVHLSL